MTFLQRCCGLCLLTLPFAFTAASAQVSVRAPLTDVDVGPDQVRVRAPFVRLQLPAGPPAWPRAFVVPVPPPAVPPAVVVPQVIAVPPPAGAAPLTPGEFAATFRPVPGTYEVVLQHPFTLQPVKVVFTLPASAGFYRVRVRPRFIEFDGPDHAVEIRFLRDGRVEVDKY